MDFDILTDELTQLQTECLVVSLFKGSDLPPSAAAVDAASGGLIKELIQSDDITGKLASTLMLFKVPGIVAKRVLVVGLGEETKLTGLQHRKAINAVMKQIKTHNLTDAALTVECATTDNDDRYRQIRHNIEWCGTALYQYDETLGKKPDPSKLTKLSIVVSEDEVELAETALLDATSLVNGINLARELGNLPGNVCTPTYLADQAQQLANEFESIECEILDEDQMRALGMNCLLSVGHGSEEPSKLIVIKYSGGESDQAPHVLVGKGITFDTGGISIKPGLAMDEMKYDMCGAASAIGAIAAVADMRLPLNVITIVAAAENMPSGQATKPGDVVTTLSGQTVEILNTDAEGRLVLCDALTYAERFKPASVVDIATLTGACIVALGNHASGLLANDQALADSLLEAGLQANDKAWQLPLWDEYQPLLDSNFADIANIGGPTAGTITAACFLSRFTKEYRWAHLDIAGVAWLKGDQKGATGRCVPLLCQYLMNQSADEA